MHWNILTKCCRTAAIRYAVPLVQLMEERKWLKKQYLAIANRKYYECE